MFTLLTTWISERIITVTAVSVLTVAAVPTTLVIVSHDDHKTTAIAVIQPVDAKQKVLLVAAVKKAGDATIAQLNGAESSCNGTVRTTVSAAKLAPAKIQAQLTKAQSQIHGSVSPFIAAIQKDEDRFAHLSVITPQDEENELHEISLIQLTALGDGHSTGTVTITCQTVVVTIQETIQITITPAPICPPTSPKKEGDD